MHSCTEVNSTGRRGNRRQTEGQTEMKAEVKAEVKTWVELANTNRISLF